MWDRRNPRYKLNLGLVCSKEIAACGTGGTPGINSILVWFVPRRLQLVGQEEPQVKTQSWFGLVWFVLVYRSGPRRLLLVEQEEPQVKTQSWFGLFKGECSLWDWRNSRLKFYLSLVW